MNKSLRDIRAVLFDLDGTLADTAPDLVAAINKMRVDRDIASLPYEQLRKLASHGARGLVGAAFGKHPGDDGYDALKNEFLANYEAALCIDTQLFDGVPDALDALTAQRLPWGIVTNKVARLTDPLVRQLGLAQAAACVVSGDTTAHSKPHPAPLLYAAECLGIDPRHIIYVGDDLRDIEAGKAAGMSTIAAAYGYCGDGAPPTAWQADALLDHASCLLPLLYAGR